ncbi:MAG TPA: hypothetical protein VM890_08625 [Longimicrobium sp.]|nr:hypothetical protein [Longimicrobium sp.]
MSEQDSITRDAGLLGTEFVVAGVQLQVPAQLGSTPQNVEDADGNDSLLQLSTSSGGVGSSSFTPTFPLHVGPNQTVRLELGQGNSLSLGAPGMFSVDAVNVVGGRLVVTNSGTVGINQPSPLYALDVTGTLRATSRVNFNGLPGTNSAPPTANLVQMYIDTITGNLYFNNSKL